MSSTELRKFGFNMALGMNILGCIMFYRGRGHFIYFSLIGSSVFILAILEPHILKPLKYIIDKVIFLLNRIVTVVTLSVGFYLIFTPVSILLKIFKKDLLNETIDKNIASYWVKRKKDIFTKGYYERMG
ncbi:MAG: hypothetical protein ABIG92_01905 [Candidatus Omnitrophota bacterium]